MLQFMVLATSSCVTQSQTKCLQVGKVHPLLWHVLHFNFLACVNSCSDFPWLEGRWLIDFIETVDASVHLHIRLYSPPRYLRYMQQQGICNRSTGQYSSGILFTVGAAAGNFAGSLLTTCTINVCGHKDSCQSAVDTHTHADTLTIGL